MLHIVPIYALALFVGLGCAERTHASPVALSFEMSVVDDGLEIHYEVTNRRGTPIHVVDKLVVHNPQTGKFERTDRLSILNSRGAGDVQFSLASIGGDGGAYMTHGATYQPVPAGKTHRGSVTVPYPIKAWNPVGGARALRGHPLTAIFVLGYYEQLPTQWAERPSAAGPLLVPAVTASQPRLLVTRPQFLPLASAWTARRR